MFVEHPAKWMVKGSHTARLFPTIFSPDPKYFTLTLFKPEHKNYSPLHFPTFTLSSLYPMLIYLFFSLLSSPLLSLSALLFNQP